VRKQLKTLIGVLGRNGDVIVFMAQNSQWYLTINVGIGMRKTIPLVNFTLSYGKNTMGGYWRIGRVRIWDII